MTRPDTKWGGGGARSWKERWGSGMTSGRKSSVRRLQVSPSTTGKEGKPYNSLVSSEQGGGWGGSTGSVQKRNFSLRGHPCVKHQTPKTVSGGVRRSLTIPSGYHRRGRGWETSLKGADSRRILCVGAYWLIRELAEGLIWA